MYGFFRWEYVKLDKWGFCSGSDISPAWDSFWDPVPKLVHCQIQFAGKHFCHSWHLSKLCQNYAFIFWVTCLWVCTCQIMWILSKCNKNVYPEWNRVSEKVEKQGLKKFPIPIMIRGCFINSNCYSMGNLECHTGQWGGGRSGFGFLHKFIF